MSKKTIAVAIATLAAIGCATERVQNSGEPPQAIAEEQESGEPVVRVAGSSIGLQFPPGWYENENENPFDIQYFSASRNMNTGVFLYKSEDLASEMTPQGTLAWHIEDIGSKRESFTLVEEQQTRQLEDKTVTDVVYSGDKGAAKFYYKFALVEFDRRPDRFVVVLQIAIPSEWDQNKPVLGQIVRSARVVASNSQSQHGQPPEHAAR